MRGMWGMVFPIVNCLAGMRVDWWGTDGFR